MEKVAIVVDNGSAFSRSGFAREDKPRAVMKTTLLPPSIAGPELYKQEHFDTESTTESKTYPIKHGIIIDWETMENLWSYLFYGRLRVSTEDHPLLMSDSPSCPTTNREKMAEVLFEGFGIPALNVSNTGFLSLCSCGKVTGLAVEAGAGVSHVTTIYAGNTWKEGTQRLDVAGRSLCKYMHHLLLKSTANPQLIKNLDKKTVTQLKKEYCYVSMDYERDLQEKASLHPVSFETPDGHLIMLDKERFCCPEPLFRPHLLSQSTPGLHLLACQSLQKLPEEYKTEVINNIVLAGGSSVFPGFPQRMGLELDALLHGRGCRIKILAAPERTSTAWLGGSLVASLHSFQHFWMRKEEYQEHGAAYVHEKFK